MTITVVFAFTLVLLSEVVQYIQVELCVDEVRGGDYDYWAEARRAPRYRVVGSED